MAFTRDGTRLVTGGASRGASVVVWDVKTGERLLGIHGAGFVSSLAISPDGKRIASTGHTGRLGENPTPRTVVWDAHTGKELFAITNEHTGERPCVAFSPDGKRLATGTLVGKGENAVGGVQFWDPRTGAKIGEPLIGPSEGFGQLTFSPDGKTLAAASWGRETFVVLWDVETRQKRAVLGTRRGSQLIRSLAFSPDSSRLAWVTGNEWTPGIAEHLLWDAATGQRIGSLRTDDRLAWVAFAVNGASLATVSLDGDFRMWKLPALEKASGFGVEFRFPTMVPSAALSPDGKALFLGTGSPHALAPLAADLGTIRIFDALTGRERLAPEKEAQRARDEAAEAARLAAGIKTRMQREEQEKQQLAKLSPEARTRLERADRHAAYLRYALEINLAHQAIERGQLAAARTLLEQHIPRPAEPDLRGFEWHHLWRQCQFHQGALQQRDSICASWQGSGPRLSPDGKTLAVATVEHDVNLWDVARGKQFATLRMPGPIWHLAFSPDSKALLTAGGKDRRPLLRLPASPKKDDPSAREASLWEVSTGKRLTKFDSSKVAVGCVAFTADGKSVAIGDWQGSVHVHDTASGKLSASFAVDIDWAEALAFSPDGKELAVGGLTGRLVIWNLATREPLTLREGKPNIPISSLQFDRSGTTLYVTEGNWPDNYASRRWSRDRLGTWTATREWKQVHRLALSPSGKRLALSGWHGIVQWDESEDREIGRIVPRVTGEGLDSELAFAPDSKTLLVHAHDIRGQPEYILFDADTGRRLDALDIPLSLLNPSLIHLDTGGRMTAIGGDRGNGKRMLTVLRATLGQAVRTRRFDEPQTAARITSLAFSPDGERLAVSNSASLFVWDWRTDKQSKTQQFGNQPISSVRFSASGTAVLSADPSGVGIWDSDTLKQKARIKAYSGSIGADGKTVYVARGEHTVEHFAAEDGKPIPALASRDAGQPDRAEDLRSGSVFPSPAGKWVVGPGPILFDAAAGKEIKRWLRNPVPVHFLFTADEKSLLTTDPKGTLTILNLPELTERHVVPQGGIALALSPDSRTALVRQDNGRLVLFDVISGTTHGALSSSSGEVGQVVFTPDGKSLVLGCTDGTLRFCCPVTGAQRLSLRAHGGPITALAISTDTSTLASGSDETVSVRPVR
jgi:WD40 repeat protein